MVDGSAATRANRRLQSPSRALGKVDVAWLVAHHATLRGLCDSLEICADQLPDRDAIIEGIRVSSTLVESLRHHETVESDILGGIFEADRTAPVSALFARIRHRHAVDHLHAEDLRDALAIAARMNGLVRSDTLSYMMRCLFDGCRRGIDFREAVFLTLARDRLTRAARAAISASLTGAT